MLYLWRFRRQFAINIGILFTKGDFNGRQIRAGPRVCPEGGPQWIMVPLYVSPGVGASGGRLQIC
jgi:hypothetical protein